MTFLDDVLETKRREVESLRQNPPRIWGGSSARFAEALRVPGLSVIAEIKRRSPSKGAIAVNLDVARTARAYAEGGASAISCLTDTDYFGAQPGDFTLACSVLLPVLRKDFILDEIQVDQSVALGASAVLLIVRILTAERLKALHGHAVRCGLDVLVEVHDETEVARALDAGASVVGVNNRDLGTLVVDPDRAVRLRDRIPRGVVSVAESGVKTREDVKRIEDAAFDAVLVGETLSRSPDPAATLRELAGRSAGGSK